MADEKRETYTFRMTFRGLCLLVPGTDDEGLAKYTVLLPEAWPDSTIMPQLADCATHHPLLSFQVKNVAHGHKNLDPYVGEQSAFIPLRWVKLRIDLTSQNMTANLCTVPNLDSIHPKAGSVCKDVVDDPSLTDLTMAQVILRRGHLKAGPSFYYKGSPVLAQFTPLPADGIPFAGELASSVVLEISGLHGAITLVAEYFKKPGAEPFSLTLHPSASADGRPPVIAVGVQNVCGDQVMGIFPNKQELPAPDHDFAWHYLFTNQQPGRLCNAYAALDPVPLPVPMNYAMYDQGQSGGLPVRCGPAQANQAQPAPENSPHRRLIELTAERRKEGSSRAESDQPANR